MSLASGARLGPYEIVGHLGSGGMGEVYRARDMRLDREVAVKVLPGAFADDADRLARFDREAKAIAALSHPNILAIFDTGTTTDAGRTSSYVVTELLDGQTLRDRLNDGALPVRKAVEYAVQIARGLAAAHDKGLVHRDLKPENVFILPDGQIKILDFGLARSAIGGSAGSGATETVAAMTDPGTVMGTVGYMAPEQVRGHMVDARTDLFAFGIVLYEMLAGQRAFHRETGAETMTAILKEDPPDLTTSRAEISPALERIVRHCLEKSPTERFQSARDVAFALGALSGSASNAPVSGAQAIAADARAARPRGPVVLAAVAVAALLLGTTFGYLGRGGAGSASAGVADVTYVPVTFEDGFVFAARFAPDNRTIVYSADWDGQPRGVFVTSLDSLEYRPLGLSGADLLGISRDGQLAILSDSIVTGGNPYWRIGTLAKASLTGGAPRAELDGVRFADFGANGTMAVVRTEAQRQTVEFPVGQILAERPTSKSGTYFSGQGDYASPRVSPSGDYVAFFDVTAGAAFKVRVFDKAGKFITESRPFVDWWALAWTPSNEVWFAAAETAGMQTAIFSLDLKGRERTVFRAPGSITLHDISALGDVLVSFDRGAGRLEMIEGADPMPTDRSWREAGDLSALSQNHALLISGNGDSAGVKGSAYVWRPEAPQPVRISDGYGLALSPDGSKAFVVSQGAPLTMTIVPTGVGQPQVVDLGVIETVQWAGWLPDGRLVIQVVRPGAEPVVAVLSASGTNPVPLLPSGVRLLGHGGNLIAPDGSRVVGMDAEGQYVVCTIATPACRVIEGIREGDEITGWAAGGGSLFVTRREPGDMRVDRLDLASGRRATWKAIRPLNPAVSGLRKLLVASDGTVAYDYRRNSAQLYVIKGLK